LAAACEGLANAVYAACDIAAMFAHRASKRLFAGSFNGIRGQIAKGIVNADEWFGGAANLKWYARVRELRTEWTHHSTVFIGGPDTCGEPQIVVKPLRRQSDRVVLPERALLRVQDLLDWSAQAIRVVDRFGLAVYLRYVLPQLNLDDAIWDLVRDEQGFPLLEDNRVQTSQTTIRDYLWRAGFEV
ncbi:MAG: hypothetical protein KDA51_18045, partial [Planctomycetales bacterium]|nr:hypothetical protein [Planctomycetales bacterium]